MSVELHLGPNDFFGNLSILFDSFRGNPDKSFIFKNILLFVDFEFSDPLIVVLVFFIFKSYILYYLFYIFFP